MSSLLERVGRKPFSVNPIQQSLDTIWQSSGDIRQTAPVIIAGAGFRLGRLGVLALGATKTPSKIFIKGLSYASGLALEASLFEVAHRALNGGIWKWSGPEGMQSGFLSSALTFGLLRGTGSLVEKQNPIFRHFFQDVSTVLGQDLASSLTVIPAHPGNFFQRLFETEITNQKMIAGLALYGNVFPRASRVEKMWDLQLGVQGESLKSTKIFPKEKRVPVFSTATRLTESLERNAAAILDWYASRDGSTEASTLVNRLRAEIRVLQTEPLSDSISYQRAKFAVATLEGLYQMHRLFGNDAFVVDQIAKHFAPWSIQGRNPYDELRFSPDHQHPKTVQYSSELKEIWAFLQAALHRSTRVLDESAHVEEIYASRVDDNQVNQIWFQQMIHFAQEVGARVRLKPADSLLASFDSRGTALPDSKLRSALHKLRARNLGEEAYAVLELTIPYGEVVFGKEEPYVDKAYLSSFLEIMQSRLMGYAHFVDTSEPLQAPVVIRIPSLSLMETLLQEVHPENAPRFFYVNGEVSRDAMIKARGMGLAAIGVVAQPVNFGDLNVEVPPWVFSIHDVFHGYMSSGASPDLKRFVARHVHDLCQEGFSRNLMGEYYVGQLIDMNFSERIFFKGSLRFIRNDLDLRISRSELEKADFVRALDFLNAYEAFIARKETESVSHSHYYGEVKEAIRESKDYILHLQFLHRWTGLLGLQVRSIFVRR